MRKITKLFKTLPTSINDTDKTVVFKISDGKPDRQGEIVDQKSWDFTEYMDNPILIASHKSDDLVNGLGTCEELWYEDAEDATYGRFKFATAANEKALLAWNLLKAGVLRTVSVGFISEKTEYDDGVATLYGNKLLETSCVLVPANPRAIALSFREGSINRKDAEWLKETMTKEIEFLDEQFKADNHEEIKEKAMEEQLEKLTGLVSKLAESQAALIETVAAITPKAETDEEKTAREAKEAEDAQAKIDAEAAEAKAIADQEEADKKAAEEAANDGGDDQSGAEFDEDAQLTPEQEAELETAFQEEMAVLEPAQ
jgi:hypothetical protein